MLKNWLKVVLILILILILGAGYFRHKLCKFYIEKAAAKATGLKLAIENLQLDILNNSLSIQEVTLFNPDGFKDKILAKSNQIFIQYYPLSLLAGKMHLRLVKIDIEEINIIRNEEGRSNVSAFRKKKEKAKSSTETPPNPPTQKSNVKERQKPPRLLIDRLELSSVKATYINYQAKIGQTAVIPFEAKGPIIFTNVTNLADVANSVSIKGGFKTVLNKVTQMPQDILKTTTENIKKTVDDILPTSKQPEQ